MFKPLKWFPGSFCNKFFTWLRCVCNFDSEEATLIF